MKKNKIKLSERVRIAMEREGINKTQLEELSGLSHGSVVGITRGEKDDLNINADTLLKLCKALNVTSDYLVGLSDTLSPSCELEFISHEIGLSVKSLENLTDLRDFAKVENEEEGDFYDSFEILDLILSNDSLKLLMDDIHEYFKYSMIRNERYMVSLDQPLFFNKTNERCKNVVIDGRAIMQTMLFKVGSVLELIASDSKYGDRYFEAECNFDKYSIPVESVEDIENMKKCTNDSVTIGYLNARKNVVKRKNKIQKKKQNK